MNNNIKTIVAVLAALTLLITGTFAFNQIVNATNEFMGQKDGVTLHDDFDPGDNIKDVYVENSGSVTVYVRIKLDEAMSLTDYTWRPGSNDWVTHVHGSDCAEDCERGNAAGKLFHDNFKWTMGGWKYYMPTDGSSPLAQDTTVYNGSEPGVKATPNAQVITAKAFLAMNPEQQKAFMGWIYSEDGYAYWSQALKGGEATGLLLNGVETLPKLKHTNYYYAINVILEAADKADGGKWIDDTDNQDEKEVINIILGGSEDEEVEVKIIGSSKEIGVGETYELNYSVSPAEYANNKEISWSSSNPNFASISVGADGKCTVSGVAVGQTTITLTVGDYSDSITINVAEKSTPEVEINGGSQTLAVGEQKQLTYSIYPAGFENGKTVVWHSNNDGVVTVDNNGKITGIAQGTTTIILTIGEGAEAISSVISVTVTDVPVIEPAHVNINEGNQSIKVNDNEKLTYTVSPAGYDSGKLINWSSNKPAVVTVVANADGTANIIGIGEGTATITLTIVSGGEEISDSISVTVSPADPIGGGELNVKPSDPNEGYKSRNNNERVLFSADFSEYCVGAPFNLTEPGVIRLEDVLEDMADAIGLQVAPKDSQYAGDFAIGSAKTFANSLRPDVEGILYSVELTYERALPLQGSSYPLTVELILTAADGRTAEIKITMQYNGIIAWN